MALTTELLTILDNTDEPLPKRLKIANNAFISDELQALNKESVLLQWLSKIGAEEDTSDVWDTLNICLSSQHVRLLRSNEIRQDVLTNIVKMIIKRFKQELKNDLRNSITICSLTILKSDLFQQYFRHDMKRYCNFISVLLVNIDDINILLDIMKNIFNKKIVSKTDYNKYFLFILNSLIEILIKFPNENLFKSCVNIIQRALFPFYSKEYLHFCKATFNEEDVSQYALPNNVLSHIKKELYNNDTKRTQLGFKLIFVSFLSSYKSEPLLIYQFLVLLLQTIGFNIKEYLKIELSVVESEDDCDFNKSLEILADIFGVLSEENITINNKINDISFSDCVKSLLISIIRLKKQANESILKIIKYVIIIDPLIIDATIKEILVFITLPKKHVFYSDVMISIFEMYLKLHRVHKFCSELLRSVKDVLFGEFNVQDAVINFAGPTREIKVELVTSVKEILPEKVMNYFKECITLQSNKQIISIMRTFIMNLKEVTDNLIVYAEDTNKVLYAQVVSELTCEFLSAIRIAEHTTTDITVQKFLKDLEDLKAILQAFGTALLKMEHNHTLMFSFLNISYVWAEIAILLQYYEPAENINLTGNVDVDYSANNLTYLHSYLTNEQWSLISQRIKNFGEQPCKYVLQKLVVQKLRAMTLFEKEINNTIQTAIITNYSNHLDNSWDIIFKERFVSANIIPKMENNYLIELAELIIKDILNKNQFDILQLNCLTDCRDLVTSLFYICLSKINALFKKKTGNKPISSRIFQLIDVDLFIKEEKVDISNLITLFEEPPNNLQLFKIDADRFSCLMEIIKHLPILFLSHDLQITLFAYLLSICVDLQSSGIENSISLDKCEQFLIGLTENTTSPNLLSYPNSHYLINCVIKHVDKYKEVLKLILNKSLKDNQSIIEFKPIVNLLVKNITNSKYLCTSVITLNGIQKAFKYKITEDNKIILRKYRSKICKKIVEYILAEETIEDHTIEAYVLVLQNYLIADPEGDLEKVKSIMKKYIDYAIANLNKRNANGCLLLFEVILTNKSLLMPSDFILSAWKAFKDLPNHEEYDNNFNKTLSLVFEHISVERFPTLLKDLLNSAIQFLNEDKLENLTNQLNIWVKIMNSSLNGTKQNIYLNMLQSLFEHILVYIMNSKFNKEFYEAFVNLQKSLIENKQLSQLPSIIDIYFQTSQIIIQKDYTQEEFTDAFNIGFSILEALVKYKNALLVDRLPTFLMQYRFYLSALCVKSNAENNVSKEELLNLAHCGFRMEFLMKYLCALKKDMARLAPYLVADILKEYEKITLYPEVKNHLNNCLNILLDLCDHYAISYLMRVLSVGSTELFKNVHENYKKYYKFTGKV